jgi:exonuclease VII large subunit
MTTPNRKRRWLRLAALLLLLLLGYGTYRAVRPDPNLKKVKQLREEFTAHAKEWTADQRQEKGKQMRDAMTKLSPAQRDAMAAEGRQRFQQELERYAKMSAADKRRYLDERIDQSERMRQQFARQNPNGTGPRPGGGGPGTFAAGPGGSGGPGGRPATSPEERERRRKERLDQTTPEFRALMDQFRKDMNARRQQRGLPPNGPR